MEFSVGDGFLSFCDQNFWKTCPGLDGYEVVTASDLGRKVRVIENIMV
jgi:hypothetical protein